MGKHGHWCKPCVKQGLKWGAVLYAAHWVLHVIAFVIAPAFGAWLLLLF